jgi:hypothetical protein
LWEEPLLTDWEFDECAYCKLSDDLQLLHDPIIEEIVYSPDDAYPPEQASQALLAANRPEKFLRCVSFCARAQTRICATWESRQKLFRERHLSSRTLRGVKSKELKLRMIRR